PGPGRTWLQVGVQLYVLADQPMEYLEGPADHAVDIDNTHVEHLLAAEGQELLCEGSGVFAGSLNSFGILLDPVGVLPGWHQQEVAVGEYDCEQIVEVMSYTAGEAPDRLHFLRLKELLFQPSPFSNVKHITFDLDEFARGVKDANGILDNV